MNETIAVIISVSRMVVLGRLSVRLVRFVRLLALRLTVSAHAHSKIGRGKNKANRNGREGRNPPLKIVIAAEFHGVGLGVVLFPPSMFHVMQKLLHIPQ